jgi:hypothetical protein
MIRGKQQAPSLRVLAELGATAYRPSQTKPGSTIRFKDGSVYEIGHLSLPDERGHSHWEGSELHFLGRDDERRAD